MKFILTPPAKGFIVTPFFGIGGTVPGWRGVWLTPSLGTRLSYIGCIPNPKAAVMTGPRMQRCARL